MVGKTGPRAGGSIDHIYEEFSYPGMYVSCDVAINRSVICSMGMDIVHKIILAWWKIFIFSKILPKTYGRLLTELFKYGNKYGEKLKG